VGELVPPKGADTTAQPGGTASGPAGDQSTKPVAASSADKGGTSGIGIALAVTGGLLVLLAAGVFLVNRRWPVPDLVRRRTRR
jgi:D-alanyl-D-alanine carboxypeptidase (penicillin-binding protein 5/6)